MIKSSEWPPSEWVKGKRIDTGSFGHVYIAMNKANGRLFVVKSSKSDRGWKSLEHEADVLMNLNSSQHVVKCLGKEVTHETNGECMYNIFLEHIGGGSLNDIVDKFGGPLSEDVVRSYTKQILASLDFLHEKGIVHCDIKCKNVLLDSNGEVKLADFGCAQKAREVGEKHDSLSLLQCVGSTGTPLWMAPEVLRDEGLDHAADIWSLGCTIIEMATGKPPWGDDIMSSNSMATVLKIAKSKEKPQFPDKLSKDGLDFLQRCLQRNPRKRSTARELLCHPFVCVNKSNCNTNSIQDQPYTYSPGSVPNTSPASVLNVDKIEKDFSDCEDESNQTSSLSSRGLVPMMHQVERKELSDSLGCNEQYELSETPETWIVVRSN